MSARPLVAGTTASRIFHVAADDVRAVGQVLRTKQKTGPSFAGPRQSFPLSATSLDGIVARARPLELGNQLAMEVLHDVRAVGGEVRSVRSVDD